LVKTAKEDIKMDEVQERSEERLIYALIDGVRTCLCVQAIFQKTTEFVDAHGITGTLESREVEYWKLVSSQVFDPVLEEDYENPLEIPEVWEVLEDMAEN
jgi:hypothetical protein